MPQHCMGPLHSFPHQLWLEQTVRQLKENLATSRKVLSHSPQLYGGSGTSKASMKPRLEQKLEPSPCHPLHVPFNPHSMLDGSICCSIYQAESSWSAELSAGPFPEPAEPDRAPQTAEDSSLPDSLGSSTNFPGRDMALSSILDALGAPDPLTREQERNGIPSSSGFKCQHFHLH